MYGRSSRRGVLALAGALGLASPLLSGCGLRPLYATRADGTAGPAERGLAEIDVALIPERAGQLLRQALQARFDHGNAGIAHRYDLVVTYGIATDIQGIDQTTSAPSRYRITGTANWSLTAQNPQRSTLASGTVRSTDGMNLFDGQFFAMDMENDAVQRRISEAVADQMTLQLAVYFNRLASNAPR